MIEAENVSLSSAGRRLLGPLDIDLKAGRTTVLLGPNGAGKSSLVRLLSGVARADTGVIRFNGRSIEDYSPVQRAQRLAVLTQHMALEFPFTAEEVVALGRSPFEGDPGAIVAELIELFDIKAAQVYTTMSGGERQLVQLARVLAQVWNGGDSAYLMLDEPMTALDLRHQAKAVQMLKRLSAAGTGQLIVMHDINLAADVADEIMLMYKGELVAMGLPQDVMTVESISAVFGTPVELISETPHRMFRTKPM